MASRDTSEFSELNIEDLKLKGFKVHEIAGTATGPHANSRRDFYKIVLVTGEMTICYGDQTIEMTGTFLFFANPHVTHSVVRSSTERKGYACMFTEAFVAGRERAGILQNSPLFRSGGTPAIPLNGEQAAFMTGIYQKMLSVHASDYDYKDELLRSCIELIIHEALRIQPQNALKEKNAATRITWLFMELLERQFPIEST
jgi:AraC family transcriptional activator of pobA